MGGKTKGVKKTFNHSVERGFTIGSAVMLGMLVLVIVFTARFVIKSADSNKQQGAKLGEALYGDETPNNEADDEYVPQSPESGSTERDINRVNVEIQALDVTLIATLPNSFDGDCYAEVSLPDGSELRRFTEELDNSDTCAITIPRNKLLSGKTWKFQMSYQTDSGLYHGDHPEETFSL